MTNQVNLEEQPPARETIRPGIPWFSHHEVTLRFLVHQRDGHYDVVCDRETDLQVRAQRNLHSQQNIGKRRHEFSV